MPTPPIWRSTDMVSSSQCAALRRWRVSLPLPLLLTFLLLRTALPAVSAARLLYNASLTIPAGSQYTYLPSPFLSSSWSPSSLCSPEVPARDCALQVRVTQTAPDPSSGCGIAVAVQVACQTQVSAGEFPSQVCVSSLVLPDGTASTLFPQDSPTLAFGATSTYLHPSARGRAPRWSVSQPQSQSIGNPAYLTVSPARVQAMYEVATRNNQPMSTKESQKRAKGVTSQQLSSSHLGDSPSLPITVLFLQPFPGECPAVSFTIQIEAVQNSLCQSAWTRPGGNGTKPQSGTVQVPCTSLQGACVTAAPVSGNTTSYCECDPGFGSDASGTDCLVEYGMDLSSSPDASRPLNPFFGMSPSAASMLWTQPMNYSAKGPIVEVAGLQLNQTSTGSRAGKVPVEKSVDQLSSPYYAYWYAKLNLSSSLSDLSLVIHFTLVSSAAPPSPALSMQVQLATRFYPTVAMNVPMGCMNASDLTMMEEGNEQTQGERTFRVKNGACRADGGLQFQPTSCMNLTQSFPDQTTPFASPTSFKLLLPPPFLRGLFNPSSTGSDSPGPQATVGNVSQVMYLSLFFQQDVEVDVRAWWQEDVAVMEPLVAPPPPPSSASVAYDPAASSREAQEAGGLSEERPARWLDLPTSSSPSLSDLPPAVIPYSSQSYTSFLYENELVYFTLNMTGPPPDREEMASLYVVVNDTQCVSGLVASGFYAPHWWRTPFSSNATAEGINTVGLNDMAQPPTAVSGTPSMALAGGCIRPTDRYASTPSNSAGYFGQIFSICSTWVSLSVFHVPPVKLNTAVMNTFVPAQLNATGSTCWREFVLTIGSSVQNDLLITVDQSDAVILMQLNTPPTIGGNYNKTQQTSIDDDNGTPNAWQQTRIAYQDLSNLQTWYLSVYLDPTPGSTTPQAPRSFRVQVSWASNSTFKDLSLTSVILLISGSIVVAALIGLALKLRVDACRRERSVAQAQAGKGRGGGAAGAGRKGNKERIRLMSSAGNAGGRDSDYSRLA